MMQRGQLSWLLVPVVALLGVLGASFGARATPAVNVQFVDVAVETGYQDPGQKARAQVARDFDGDGWLDFYIGNPGDTSLIFFAKTTTDATGKTVFDHFERGPALLTGELAFGASAADYDNDGCQDLFVAIGGHEGIGWDHLFRNACDGTGRMIDVSATARIQGPHNADGSMAATASIMGVWGDYDLDGDLDLFVSTRELPISPPQFKSRNSLFRNNGDGTFADVTAAAGLDLPQQQQNMAAAWGDVDDDGWPDLFVPSLVGRAMLYMNNHDGTFRTNPMPAFRDPFLSFGAIMADYNNDGLLDILSLANDNNGQIQPHGLYINRGKAGSLQRFTNEAIRWGLSQEGVHSPYTMGNAVGDIDNDGFLEIFTSDGRPVVGQEDMLWWARPQPDGTVHYEDISYLVDYPAPSNPAFRLSGPLKKGTPGLVVCNDMTTSTLEQALAAGIFKPVCNLSARPGVQQYVPGTFAGMPYAATYPYRGHGTAFADYDRDGDLDILSVKGGPASMPETIEPNRLFRNDGGNANHWLFVDVVGSVSNRDGAGARVRVNVQKPGGKPRDIYREIQDGTGFSAAQPHEAHFGLGQDTQVNAVEVRWPSGVVQTLTGVGIDRTITVREQDALLFADSFDGGLTAWTQALGSWWTAEGTARTCGTGESLLLATGQSSLTDYTVATRFTFQGGTFPQVGVIGRANADGSRGYVAVLGDGKVQLFRKNGVSSLTPLSAVAATAPMKPGQGYLVQMSFTGSRIQVTVDGKLVADVSDGTYPAGTFGFDTQNACTDFYHLAAQ